MIIIGPQQFKILKILRRESAEPLSPTYQMIADEIGVSKQRVSIMISRLIEKGLVKHSGGYRSLQLTQKGKEQKSCRVNTL